MIGRSTGGLIALELARRHPEMVTTLVLLEPAVLTLHPDAAAWGQQLRRAVLDAAEEDPSSASEVVFREVVRRGSRSPPRYASTSLQQALPCRPRSGAEALT